MGHNLEEGGIWSLHAARQGETELCEVERIYEFALLDLTHNLFKTQLLLDPSWEADCREKQTIEVEVLEHALNRMSINTEGDAGHAQIQTAAHYILGRKNVVIGRRHLTWYATWWEHNAIDVLSVISMSWKRQRKVILTCPQI